MARVNDRCLGGSAEAERVMTSRRMNYFLLLTPEQQLESVRRLSRSGLGDYSIAAASGLSVEQVRRVLARPHAETQAHA